MSQELTQDEIVLIVLASAKKPLTPVQLQKSVFLLQEMTDVTEIFEFSAYDYGPFCSGVYRTAEQLQSNGLAEIRQPLERGFRLYEATESGRQEGKSVLSSLPKNLADYIAQLVSWVSNLSFQDLVKAVYKQFPAYKQNSIFKDC